MRALPLAAILLTLPLAARANEYPKLEFPVACTLGETCWVANYADVDPAESAKDFMCGPRSYDTHKGTDIALRDVRAVNEGVFVLAATDGTVERVRDGEPDSTDGVQGPDSLSGKECGNGILVRHESGLRTLYCHLKKGSLTVKPGDTVVALQPIAKVGQSGLAEFPHLHLELLAEDERLDPFTGQPLDAGCGIGGKSLWKNEIGYTEAALYADGFTTGAPDFEALKADASSPERLPADIPALVYWFAYYGASEGDRIAMEILGPDGSIFSERALVQDKTRARQFYYAGSKVRNPLAPGLYTGRVTVRRGEDLVFQRQNIVAVGAR